MIDVSGRKAIQEALKLAGNSLSLSNHTDLSESISIVMDAALGYVNESSRLYTSQILSIPGFTNAQEDLPGLYEYLLSLKPNHSLSAFSRKATGSFYTHSTIVQYVVEQCLETLFENSPPPGLDDIRILDPAVGCGGFLLEAASQLSKKLKKNMQQIADCCLYGWDVDPIAVNVTRSLLSRHREPSQSVVNHIKTGDSLLQEIGMFDIVLGNPPWISLKGKHKSGTRDEIYISKIQKRFGGDTYRPNLMESFVRMAIENLKPGGVNCFIVPDRLAANAQFAGLRAMMLRDNDLREIIFRVPFDGVCADTMIYLLVKGKGRMNVNVSYWGQQESRVQVASLSFLHSSSSAIFHPGTSSEQSTLQEMEARSVALCPDVARTATGFIGASGAITSERIYESQLEVIRGRNILTYALQGCAYFDPAAGIVGGTKRTEVLGASPKLLVRKTGLRIIAAFCDQPVWPEQSVYQIWESKGGYSLYYIMAVLNSSSAEFYCRMRMLTNRDTTPQIKKIDLDRFPIPKIDFTTTTSDRKRRTELMPDKSDCNAVADFAKQEIDSGRMDVLHDIISDFGRQMCQGVPCGDVQKAIDILVAALYHLPDFTF